MEIVEEGINQPKITQKRIKVEEIVEKEEEDRISALPDCVLLEILSRLSFTKSAIRTGTLSKRWKYLWTSVSTLIFIYYLYDKRPLSDFVSFVDKTLSQSCQSKLRKFALKTRYDIQFESQVNNWIRYAISCNVEELDFGVYNEDIEAVFMLNEDFFISSCFIDLKLSYCIFNPKGAIGWKSLRSLYIGSGYLDEDVIQKILSGSPLLETLELERCYGYRRLDITSKRVKNLVFTGYRVPEDEFELADIIEINAPNILSPTIQGDLFLWKLLLLNVSSLVEAYLDFSKGGHHAEPTEEEAQEEMLKGFIRSLCHVKELEVGPYCSKDVYKQVMPENYDPDTVVRPPADTELLEQSVGGSHSTGRSYAGSTSKEVQQLKEKIQKLEQKQAEQEAEMKEMRDTLKALEELLHSRFPPPPPPPS